ncbi:GNAT family N-acetyltransferase [Paraferrimonas sedimenticola]|uniref:N-acetyltransferase GCN5 n=1 Tax=Paraferrimonas sedimenticola TaxID=375674 RepID=A0AA37W1D8_9GAMM|nr:GNAT family N-acetyltransferase [Paraferrimonas sedimenticola]GLP96733.1 N-acetyltransferase GCN5 [Paraferrimonas sedimenticola]
MSQAALDASYRAAYLTPEDFRVAASLLFSAYQDDPGYKQALGDEDQSVFEKRLRSAIREELSELWTEEQPLIGLFEQDKLVAMAGLALNKFPLGDQRYWHWRLKMMLVAGWNSTQALIEKEQVIRGWLPEGEQAMLQFVAVAKHRQRQGIGRALLEVVEQWRSEQEKPTGLVVFAPDEHQQAFFKSMGFSLHKQVDLPDMQGQLLISAGS